VIRVVIADDQALVREGFRSILERDPGIEVVGEAGDGRRAVDVVAATRPDVVLMDVRMPVLDGLSAAQRVLSGDSPPRVVVLTTYDTDDNLFEALRMGASGFLLKDIRADQLVDALHAAVSGDALVSPSLVRRLVEGYVEARRPAPSAGRLSALTPRELEVMGQVARGLSNAEVASALFLSEATVKTHINRILAKLGARDRVQLVVLAYEAGLVVPGR
jgi:DNA-binding NarL/FixJ family response regulator